MKIKFAERFRLTGEKRLSKDHSYATMDGASVHYIREEVYGGSLRYEMSNHIWYFAEGKHMGKYVGREHDEYYQHLKPRDVTTNVPVEATVKKSPSGTSFLVISNLKK